VTGMQEEIAAFFDDFNAAFATFDGSRVAAKFSLPMLARNSEGVSKVFHSQPELARYFQGHLDEYRAMSCVRCQYSELSVTALGSTAALVTVRWSLLDSAMATAVSWRESYLLNTGSGAATAFATIDHA
jgi:hypothetical protein